MSEHLTPEKITKTLAVRKAKNQKMKLIFEISHSKTKFIRAIIFS